MNSNQRRKDKRKWKFSVPVTCTHFGHYQEMWEWLADKYGTNVNKCGWRDRDNTTSFYTTYEYFDIDWQFVDERKAIEFTLRWS